MTGLRPDPQQMQTYTEIVYGSAQGFSVVGFGTPVLRDSKYAHASFRQVTYRLPEDRSRLIADACTAAPDQDVFITPLLRDGPTRRVKGSKPLPGRYVWLDVDDWTSDLEAQLIELGLPCRLVDSGGIGVRRHCYLDVGEVLPGEDIAQLAKRLAAALGTDTAGGNNKLLRLPGTWNHKGRLRGDGARPVLWLPPLNAKVRGDLGRLEAFLAERGQPTGAPAGRGLGPLDLEQSIPQDGGEEPCERVLQLSDDFRKALTGEVRHQALLRPLTRLLGAGAVGHKGVRTVIAELREEFVQAVLPARGSRQAAEEEFDRALRGTNLQSKIKGSVPYDVCSCDIDAYRAMLNRPGLFVGRTARRERRVMQSLISDVTKTQSRRVAKSQRAIAEDADCSQASVSKALMRLQDMGLLEKTSRGRSTSRLILSKAMRSDSIYKHAKHASTEIASLPSVGRTHPVFGSQGLRGNQEKTFDVLDEYRQPVRAGYLLAVRKGHGKWVPRRRRLLRDISPRSGRGGLTPKAIAALTEQPVSTVRAHLKQMRKKDLVFRRLGLWYRLAWDPDVVAREAGIDDVPAKRKERHLDERRRMWNGRAALPPQHYMHVLRHQQGTEVLYVCPRTAEVLWRDPEPAEINREEPS